LAIPNIGQIVEMFPVKMKYVQPETISPVARNEPT